jgi:TolB-like protein
VQRPPAAEAKSAPRLSIVVLPFSNLSNDPEQEYFADGITDDLTSDLSRISGSFVIARTTLARVTGLFAVEPAWSPDGRLIAFAGPGIGPGPRADVWTVNAP